MDEIGNFDSESKTVQPKTSTKQHPPNFWNKILRACDRPSGPQNCLIVTLFAPKNMLLYKCDLLISSEDLNNCFFYKQLGRCLLKESPVIYINVSNVLGVLNVCYKY